MQHLSQKLSQSNYVCKDYSKSKVGRFLRHSVLTAYVIANTSTEGSWRVQLQYTDVVRYEIEICIFEKSVE